MSTEWEHGTGGRCRPLESLGVVGRILGFAESKSQSDYLSLAAAHTHA
jgi:hypothetical protein